MKLPDDFLKQIQSQGDGSPALAVETAFDIAGNFGETWVATDGGALWVFTRRAKEAPAVLRYPLSSLSRVAVRADRQFASMDVAAPDRSFTLRFWPRERPDLDRFQALWRQKYSGTPTPVQAAPKPAPAPRPAPAPARPVPMAEIPSAAKPAPPPPLTPLPRPPAPAPPPPAPAPASVPSAARPATERPTPVPTAPAPGPAKTASALSPWVALAASLHAMAMADERIDAAEVQVVTRTVGDSKAIAAGMKFVAEHGVDELLRVLHGLLNADQKRCLMANLLTVAMADGLLRGSEQGLLERFRVSVGMTEEDYQAIQDVLLTKQNTALFTEAKGGADEQKQLLLLFSGALQAMMLADGNVNDEEMKVVQNAVTDQGINSEASNLLGRQGVDPLLRGAAEKLGGLQQRCLLANLLSVAVADGLIRSKEQELLDRFRQAMRISEEEYLKYYGVMISRGNIASFTVSG